MRTLSRNRRAENADRWGFTLVELLVAISIIGVLMALLIPAITAARATARTAQVQAEISRLNSAVADFKAKFGMNPPSSINLYETGADWANDQRSMGIVRQLWPHYPFGDLDINNDGTAGQTHRLTGAECLVLFLGGVTRDGASVGFSANPANPFNNTGTNRVGPFFEFDISRFTDVDEDLIAEFRDTLPDSANPYLYLSANEGTGYLLADLAVGEDADNDGAIDAGEDRNGSGSLNGPPNMTQVYQQTVSTAWNPQSFQIISPGDDGLYGDGGLFNADTAGADLVGTREPERDNITNFHNGKLAPN